MLQILLGRAGAGKTTELLRRMAVSGTQRRQLLLVPEQASHEMERRLCQEAGNRSALYAEVLSFTRLGNRVLSQTGGLAGPVLDPGGRILLMYAAVKAVSASLTVFARPSRRPAFLSGLLSTLDECKQYQVSPEALARAGEEAGGQEGDKLKDLGLIFGAYDALTARTAADPRDRLTRLAEGLERAPYAQGKDVYIDGFTDFVPQQLSVLRHLMRQAVSVTVALTSSPLDEDPGAVFLPVRRTVERLKRLAEDAGQKWEISYIHDDHICKVKELSYIEQHLFSDDASPHMGPAPGVRVFAAATSRSEVEWSASEILRLTREEGLRFRDIQVVARGFDRYAGLVEEIFRRYEIPLFLDEVTDVLQKPVFSVVTGALDVVAGGYAHEDLFRYLKTGLTNIPREDCDLLENYALKWRLRGSQWTSRAEWSMHPRGYGFPLTEEDQEQLRKLDRLRRAVVGPLEVLRKNDRKTGKGQAMALYRFLEEIQLPQQLEARAERLQVCGEGKRAEEYRQLWEILCSGLEQCAQILGETPLELQEFAQLFKLVLSQYDVGTIPVSLDQVTAGEAARPGKQGVQALFFLGADDGAVPQVSPPPGLFTDDERSLLASYGLELSPSPADRMDREMTILYEACARPARHLTVSWAVSGSQGEAHRPSLLVERLLALFPDQPLLREQDLDGTFRLSAPGPAMELVGRYPQVRTALEGREGYQARLARLSAAAQERGSLSRRTAQKLYGRRVPMSASRMDKYKSCHFSYFMQFGLRARPREPAGFLAPEYGTFVHYILETVLRDPSPYLTEGEEGKACDHQKLRQGIQALMERYLKEQLGGAENKSKRFLYLFQRLIRPVTQVVENVLEELSASSFRPIDFELGFGAKGELPPVELTVDGVTLSISGLVDRVDGWVHGDKFYLRVVDYKTGRKTLDLTEIWHGLGLQMLLYLFTLEDRGALRYGREVVPAGVLYLPAREVVVQGRRSMGEEERRRIADSELRRHGLILDDPEVIDAMETPGAQGLRFLPLRVSSKTGAISGDALVSAARMGRLKRHIEDILGEICREFAAGDIDADPFWRGPEKNACLYCDYAAACHFEEGRGRDRRRYLPAMDSQRFWAQVEAADSARGGGMREEGEDGLSAD